MILEDARMADDPLVQVFCTSIEIRAFEEGIADRFLRGKIPGFLHTSIGQEVTSAAFLRTTSKQDLVASTHRGHGHAIAKGSSLSLLAKEIFGSEEGICKGRGGSMHLIDLEIGFLGANAIVGGAVPVATGAALGLKTRSQSSVSVCFFGDGAVNQGVVYESFNLAAIWSLPVVYVCENNGWAETTPVAYATSGKGVLERARAFGIESIGIDAFDVVDLIKAAESAIRIARTERRPILVEVQSYRIDGHHVGDPEKYRPRSDRELASDRDPLKKLRSLVESAYGQDLVQSIESATQKKVATAVAEAEVAPRPDEATVGHYLYS